MPLAKGDKSPRDDLCHNYQQASNARGGLIEPWSNRMFDTAQKQYG
jgi:hypothetical protein